MTLHIELTPELEARLRQQAAVAGKDMADVAREVLEERYISRDKADLQPAEIARRRAELRAWGASHRALGYEVDDSRESIYEGLSVPGFESEVVDR